MKVKIYDPSVKAYRDAELEDFVAQLEALQITGDEAKTKVSEALATTKATLIENGLGEEEAEAVIAKKIADVLGQ